MKISILDYGVVDIGKTNEEAIQETIQLAQIAEELGYERFWVAEHHEVNALSISAPEVVIPAIASQTKSIHVGSGGIMGLHYAPYKVAEVMRSLEALFPGRIDIGLGNSIGTKSVSTALKSHYTKPQFGEWIADLQEMIQSNEAVPYTKKVPEQFLLGMGGESVHIAAKNGLGFVYGIFPYIPQEPLVLAKELSTDYRKEFQSVNGTESRFILAVFVVIADTEEKAEEMAKALDLWMLGKQDFSEFETFPTKKDVETRKVTPAERKTIEDNRQRLMVGDSRAVKEQLDELCQVCNPDELLMIPLVGGFENRKRALELLAQLYQ
ncbi:MsnO8 family LLM class oxidoreductase [Granulicatella elegans]|uniref:MsnO8 family LLM class oxidoreductase n=1 Tax=Granulicatella elegans TaxID=137732 RepID=UPI001D1379D6|nr:MsnO8 family LLM class oxidoreductase [Granulicatella elegans]UEA32127.1 MsnO8 family LLM class oxidoreductase [Granulicatella elegans]